MNHFITFFGRYSVDLQSARHWFKSHHKWGEMQSAWAVISSHFFFCCDLHFVLLIQKSAPENYRLHSIHRCSHSHWCFSFREESLRMQFIISYIFCSFPMINWFLVSLSHRLPITSNWCSTACFKCKHQTKNVNFEVNWKCECVFAKEKIAFRTFAKCGERSDPLDWRRRRRLRRPNRW